MAQGKTSALTLFAICILHCGTAEIAQQAPTKPKLVFEDFTQKAGLDFVHINGMSGAFYIVEIMGAGCAFLDYDNDGDLDLYLLQGGPLDEKVRASPGQALPSDRLFRNDLKRTGSGNYEPHFVDVTEQAGLSSNTGYGMGVATGDYDNDGYMDLYVTNFGANRLWRNKGDGSFEDVTAATGTGDSGWSIPALFADFNRDGWLDLYVGNYLDYQLENNKVCFKGYDDYCNPLTYAAKHDRLFLNKGDGTFADAGDVWGVSSLAGNSLGAVASDFDGDGWLDLYIANDGQSNFLWHNQAGATFEEVALLRGCALNEMGQAEASMGIDAADVDQDGDDDLFMTHLAGETNTLYLNNDGFFQDATISSGLALPSKPFTGFGTAMKDFDGDGWLDIFAVNGAVTAVSALKEAGDPFPLHQQNQIFLNTGSGTFRDVSATAGTAMQTSLVSRGAAFGDVDQDGDIDLVISNNNGPARLLLNQSNPSRWLGINLLDPVWGAAPLSAKVVLQLRDGTRLVQTVRTAASYASAQSARVFFGLEGRPEVAKIQVYWPDGSLEERNTLALGQWHTVQRNTTSNE